MESMPARFGISHGLRHPTNTVKPVLNLADAVGKRRSPAFRSTFSSRVPVSGHTHGIGTKLKDPLGNRVANREGHLQVLVTVDMV